MKRIADSTVRRLSLYLRFLDDYAGRGLPTVSSEELAHRGGTTSAQVRKDFSLFGSFGKRGLGYSVLELQTELRAILGLGRAWRVIIVGAGKIGAALSAYRGFEQHGFHVLGVYDNDPSKIGHSWDGRVVRDIDALERDASRDPPDIAVVTVPGSAAQAVVDRVVRAGIKGILNFAPEQIHAPSEVIIRTVNMAIELEGLSFALANRSA
ncbi:MAG: redox-sensing transcriptional repressor Rex [Gemmatimonadaceae bacterium]